MVCVLNGTTERQMESIAQSAVAGLIAALVATTILGLAKYLRQWLAKRQDVRHLRGLLLQGKERVMKAEDTFHEGMGTLMPSDLLRAAQYNNMIREVGVALDRWVLNLSHAQRKDVYDALDWYHTDELYATKKDGEVVFMELLEGRWPTTEMSMEAARRKFEKLQSIKWLKLEDD